VQSSVLQTPPQVEHTLLEFTSVPHPGQPPLERSSESSAELTPTSFSSSPKVLLHNITRKLDHLPSLSISSSVYPYPRSRTLAEEGLLGQLHPVLDGPHAGIQILPGFASLVQLRPDTERGPVEDTSCLANDDAKSVSVYSEPPSPAEPCGWELVGADECSGSSYDHDRSMFRHRLTNTVDLYGRSSQNALSTTPDLPTFSPSTPSSPNHEFEHPRLDGRQANFKTLPGFAPLIQLGPPNEDPRSSEPPCRASVPSVIGHLGSPNQKNGLLSRIASLRRYRDNQPPSAPTWDGARSQRTSTKYTSPRLLIVANVNKELPPLPPVDTIAASPSSQDASIKHPLVWPAAHRKGHFASTSCSQPSTSHHARRTTLHGANFDFHDQELCRRNVVSPPEGLSQRTLTGRHRPNLGAYF
jgi:hypothetical protein